MIRRLENLALTILWLGLRANPALVGFPGALDGYQVNFRMPPNTGKGSATVQVNSAWIAGGTASIAVQ